MKTVKIIAALLAALLLTGCSVKVTVGTQTRTSLPKPPSRLLLLRI